MLPIKFKYNFYYIIFSILNITKIDQNNFWIFINQILKKYK